MHFFKTPNIISDITLKLLIFWTFNTKREALIGQEYSAFTMSGGFQNTIFLFKKWTISRMEYYYTSGPELRAIFYKGMLILKYYK